MPNKKLENSNLQEIIACYAHDVRYLPAALQDMQALLGVITSTMLAVLATHFYLNKSELHKWLQYPDGFLYADMIKTTRTQVCIGAFCREKNKELLHENNIRYVHCLSTCHQAPAAIMDGVLYAPCVAKHILSYSACKKIFTEE